MFPLYIKCPDKKNGFHIHPYWSSIDNTYWIHGPLLESTRRRKVTCNNVNTTIFRKCVNILDKLNRKIQTVFNLVLIQRVFYFVFLNQETSTILTFFHRLVTRDWIRLLKYYYVCLIRVRLMVKLHHNQSVGHQISKKKKYGNRPTIVEIYY